MVNCQLPASAPLLCDWLELRPPHADKTIRLASRKGNRLFTSAPKENDANGSRFVRFGARSVVDLSMMYQTLMTQTSMYQTSMTQTSETPLQTELYGSGPMRIQRVQEGGSSGAIGSSNRLKAGGIHRTRITTDHVVPAAAGIIGVVYSKLSVIEDIEKLRTELNLAGLRDLKVLQQGDVEVQAARIIQEVSTRITKSQSPRRHKLRWITEERTKALKVEWRRG